MKEGYDDIPSDDVLLEFVQYQPHGDHKPGEELPEGGVCQRVGMGEWSCGHEDK